MDNITVKSSGNTIKLQSTPEEVTGGYFDSEEVWHEFGGESLIGKKFKIRSNRVPITFIDQTYYFPIQAKVISGNDTGNGADMIVAIQANNVSTTSSRPAYAFATRAVRSNFLGSGYWSIFVISGAVDASVKDMIIELCSDFSTETDKLVFDSLFVEYVESELEV